MSRLEPFAITAHAVARYVERWAPGRPAILAGAELEVLVRAARLAGRTHAGDDVYLAEEVPLVVQWEDGVAVVRTVLDPTFRWERFEALGHLTADEADRLRNARSTIARHKAGERVSKAALKRAEVAVTKLTAARR